ncbi:MAG TPA: hypothetical protein DC054_06805, partial [Blastocatellia bacterium]|nr:hypothetical protein [Blastocatellia bacterium]
MMMNPRRRVIPLLAVALFFAISFQGVAQKSKPRERDERREEREEREDQQKRQPKPANQSSPNPAQSGEKQRRVDDPDDEEDMNRELWEFAKNTPYESILSYIKDAQRTSRATQTAEVELPTGWRITPAGTQVEVGR